MKRIKIVGAGIAGLVTGCYLQINGYDTEIIERHNLPGGLCTNWKRGDYIFDGCVHWLLGSSPGSSFYKLWCELIDMNSIEFINHDVRVSIEVKHNADIHGNKIFHFYSDVVTLEKYMLEISPEDKRLICQFTESIRYLSRFDFPPLIDKAPRLRTLKDRLGMIRLVPLVLFLTKWGKITNLVFAKQVKNPFLKEVFSLLFEGREYSLLVMTIQLAFFNKRCAGYPVGGSLLIAKKIEERYLALGGRINFNTSVSKILTSDQTVTGVLTGEGKIIESDIVISAADWHYTVFEALEGKFNDRNIELLAEEQILEVFDSAILVSIGVSRTFEDQPHLLRFPTEHPVKLADGSEHSRIEVNIFSYDKTLSPKGKTVLSVTLPTRNGEFWIDLRKKDLQEYKRLKLEIGSSIIDALEHRFKNIKDKVEVIDVATPATFHRYTGNWKGSIQGWLPSKKLFSPSPVKYTLPGLNNFYMTGHWTEPGGGLPIALLSARNIAQEICHNDKKRFLVK